MIFHALTTSFVTCLTLIGMEYGFLAHPSIYNAKISMHHYWSDEKQKAWNHSVYSMMDIEKQFMFICSQPRIKKIPDYALELLTLKTS
jgi:hypothetical protein